MLSYQHVFHAGNHADILKHYVLSFVLNSLNKKEKAWTFIDTHSGSGLYDLYDNRSRKTQEAEKGILKLLENKAQPQELELYLNTIKPYLEKNFYPGSPLIEKAFLRQQDILFLSELHPAEYQNLLQAAGKEKNIKVKNQNGFNLLKEITPPVTKRGAVLIDPSYEEASEYEILSQTVNAVFKKWTNGIFMIWYPLLAHRKTEIEEMLNSIKENVYKINKNTEIADLQLCVADKDSHIEKDLQSILDDKDKKNPPRLYGSGMLVINSPWHLKEEGQKVCEYLSGLFYR